MGGPSVHLTAARADVDVVPAVLAKEQAVEKEDLAAGTAAAQAIEHKLGLGGLIGATEREELLRLRELAQARFLYHRIDDSRVRPSPDDPAWIESLPVGVLRDAAGRVQELASPDFEGDRPEGASPEVAGRALMELYAIATELTP